MKLVRRSLLPLMVCVLALGLASQAVASTVATTRGQSCASAGESFSCLGTVTAVDPVAGTITVTVRHATLALQGSVGQSLTLTVTSGSTLSTYVRGAKTTVKLADVPKGDLIAAGGMIDATNPAVLVYTVGSAVVWQPAPDARFLCRGTVSSVDPQTDALAVTVGRGSLGLSGSGGKNITIDLAANARIFVATHRRWSSVTATDITAGDIVTILGVRRLQRPRRAGLHRLVRPGVSRRAGQRIDLVCLRRPGLLGRPEGGPGHRHRHQRHTRRAHRDRQ